MMTSPSLSPGITTGFPGVDELPWAVTVETLPMLAASTKASNKVAINTGVLNFLLINSCHTACHVLPLI